MGVLRYRRINKIKLFVSTIIVRRIRPRMTKGSTRVNTKKHILRRQQGSNLRGRSPTDFKSVSLTTRTYRRLLYLDFFQVICSKMLGYFYSRPTMLIPWVHHINHIDLSYPDHLNLKGLIPTKRSREPYPPIHEKNQTKGGLNK
jgi:hypothetical protein